MAQKCAFNLLMHLCKAFVAVSEDATVVDEKTVAVKMDALPEALKTSRFGEFYEMLENIGGFVVDRENVVWAAPWFCFMKASHGLERIDKFLSKFIVEDWQRMKHKVSCLDIEGELDDYLNLWYIACKYGLKESSSEVYQIIDVVHKDDVAMKNIVNYMKPDHWQTVLDAAVADDDVGEVVYELLATINDTVPLGREHLSDDLTAHLTRANILLSLKSP